MFAGPPVLNFLVLKIWSILAKTFTVWQRNSGQSCRFCSCSRGAGMAGAAAGKVAALNSPPATGGVFAVRACVCTAFTHP